MKDNRQQTRGGCGGGGGGGSASSGNDKIDALGRLLHMASQLKLDMRSDGFVNVQHLLKLNLITFANLPLRSHTVDEVRETVETESLLKPILSPEEFPVCVHGTYKKILESIMAGGLKRMTRLHVHFSCGLPTDGEVISEGMKLYISDNRVILTEGFDGVVPVKYFQKIEQRAYAVLDDNGKNGILHNFPMAEKLSTRGNRARD